MHFTNQTSNVFALKNMGRVPGAAMARYSRASGSIRDIIENEFMNDGVLSVEAADDLIERVLIAFGDDSVGELEGAHLCFENLSMLATKIIEHRRIGLSPIEKSSRYVRYDKKVNGKYPYYVPELPTMLHEFYVSTMDKIFDSYVELSRIVRVHLRKKKPITEAVYRIGEAEVRYEDLEGTDKADFKRTYNNDIKTKSCDIVRAFLPLATTTNVGLFGNGRAYQHLISKMLSSDLPEGNDLGRQAKDELMKIIPHYVRRADVNDYQRTNHQAMRDLASRYFPEASSLELGEVRWARPDHRHLVNHAVHCMYPYTNETFSRLTYKLSKNPDLCREIIRAYAGNRTSRRDRPERGFEAGYPFNFELTTEWAVYKDLMRHRMGTIQIQELTTRIGFEMPPEIVEAGQTALTLAEDIIRLSDALKTALVDFYPAISEYAVLHGHKVRWVLSMNLRALMHMIELRSAPQGHPNYRRVAQTMFRLLESAEPELAETINHANFDKIYWSRADSEAKQREKERKWSST